MEFRIRAVSPEHQVVTLQMEAVDAADARRQAQAQGYYVTTVERRGLRLPGARAVRFNLGLFNQELLALMEAGLGVVEALDALQEKEPDPVSRQVLARLLAALREGRRLSAALSDHPRYFPALFLGIVRAAEGTSDLPSSLRRYIDYQQRVDAVRAKVVGASIYPAILMSVGAAVSVFLVIFVVPRFAEVYQGSGRELPWMSALLLSWGQWVTGHVTVVLAALAVMAGALAGAWRSGRLQRFALACLERLPGAGERLLMYQLARLYLTLGMLLQGGIAVRPAMDMVGGVVSAALGLRLQAAARLVEDGVPLSEAFERNRLTTPISLRLIGVGERTGDMGGMLARSAAFYDGEIGRWLDRFMRSFEPLLMAAIGIVVGVIVVLLYMPIFDLASGF